MVVVRGGILRHVRRDGKKKTAVILLAKDGAFRNKKACRAHVAGEASEVSEASEAGQTKNAERLFEACHETLRTASSGKQSAPARDILRYTSPIQLEIKSCA